MTDTTRNDGEFRWYYGRGQEPEYCYLGGKDRDETYNQAVSEGMLEDGFTIIQASKAKPTVKGVFDANIVIEQYEERNIECWGEDGSEIGCEREIKAELEASLEAALDAWMEKHDQRGRAWCFGDYRHEEYVPPQPIATRSSKEA